jgi:hypothetical protein
MRRYIVLLLITGIVWAQTNYDKLVSKDGTKYLGEYSRVEDKIVYFRPKDALEFQAVPLELIETLRLKDGVVLIQSGRINGRNLAFEKKTTKKYEKLTIEEKAVYDAKKKSLKWGFYPMLSLTTFGVSMVGAIKITNGEIWESLLKMIGMGAISSGGPFYFLKQFKNNTESLNLEYGELYQEIYSREYRKWVLINFTTGFAVAGGLSFLFLDSFFDLSGFDACFDPNCG